jgi:hypothetical protein
MTTPFQRWLKFADEDAKREASAYRHHYPIEQIVLTTVNYYTYRDSEVVDGRYIKIVCGCNEHFAYTYGEGEHR